MIRTMLAAGGSLFLMSINPVLAHHSYSQFHDHVVSVSGTLEKVVFANPHTMLTVRGETGTVYTGNWRSAFQLQRMGVNSTDLKIGDAVVIAARPHAMRPHMNWPDSAKFGAWATDGPGVWRSPRVRPTLSPSPSRSSGARSRITFRGSE